MLSMSLGTVSRSQVSVIQAISTLLQRNTVSNSSVFWANPPRIFAVKMFGTKYSFIETFIRIGVSVKRTYHEVVEATNQCLGVRKFSFSQRVVQEWNKLSQDAVDVCESVQEQIGQVLARIWALKAWLNKPIIRQIQVQVKENGTNGHQQKNRMFTLLVADHW